MTKPQPLPKGKYVGVLREIPLYGGKTAIVCDYKLAKPRKKRRRK